MSFISDYEDLREVFSIFRKKKYFNTYSSADLFYVFDSDENRALLTFITQFFGEAYGLQCFFNRDGFNYVHDVMSVTDENAITVGDCDSIVAVYKSKEELTDEDEEFLIRMGKRKTKDSNLIVYRFQKGYRYRIAKPKEMKIISLYAVFLSSLITNEGNDIDECFKKGDSVFASLDLTSSTYAVIYRPIPYLEDNPNRLPVNMPFVEEYKNKTYKNDDCYLYASYLPVSIKETGVRPILLYFYFKKSNKMEMKYILEGPKEYKSDIYGILDDVFTEVGMPVKMIINSRDFYFILTKTLDALHIENVFERSNAEVGEDLDGIMSGMYEKTKDIPMESKKTVSMLMESITEAVRAFDSESLVEDTMDDTSMVS